MKIQDQFDFRVEVLDRVTGAKGWFDGSATAEEITEYLQEVNNTNIHAEKMDLEIIEFDAPIDLTAFRIEEVNKLYAQWEKILERLDRDEIQLIGELFDDWSDLCANFEKVDFLENVVDDLTLGNFVKNANLCADSETRFGTELGRAYRKQHKIIYGKDGAYLIW